MIRTHYLIETTTIQDTLRKFICIATGCKFTISIERGERVPTECPNGTPKAGAWRKLHPLLQLDALLRIMAGNPKKGDL